MLPGGLSNRKQQDCWLKPDHASPPALQPEGLSPLQTPQLSRRSSCAAPHLVAERAHTYNEACRHASSAIADPTSGIAQEVAAMQIVSVDQMRAIERRAEEEFGLASPVLMEHAGRSVAEHLRPHLGKRLDTARVLVLVGPGNNGGDGRVMARYLAQWGVQVTLYLWKERRLEIGSQSIPVNDELDAVRDDLSHADVVVDALLGTGNSRPLEASMRHLLRLVHEERERRPTVVTLAVDLPTGLNAD